MHRGIEEEMEEPRALITEPDADDQVMPDAPAATEALSLEEEHSFIRASEDAAAAAEGEQRAVYIVAAE
jgi:hypothetical protein